MRIKVPTIAYKLIVLFRYILFYIVLKVLVSITYKADIIPHVVLCLHPCKMVRLYHQHCIG